MPPATAKGGLADKGSGSPDTLNVKSTHDSSLGQNRNLPSVAQHYNRQYINCNSFSRTSTIPSKLLLERKTPALCLSCLHTAPPVRLKLAERHSRAAAVRVGLLYKCRNCDARHLLQALRANV